MYRIRVAINSKLTLPSSGLTMRSTQPQSSLGIAKAPIHTTTFHTIKTQVGGAYTGCDIACERIGNIREPTRLAFGPGTCYGATSHLGESKESSGANSSSNPLHSLRL
jgi:hypothetical protein